MSNMSYCRFRNTLLALTDCERTLVEDLNWDPNVLKNEEEVIAAKQLIKLCKSIAEWYEEENKLDIY